MARVLVVGDDRGLQDTLWFILRSAGHEVLTTSCARDGVAVIQRGDCDLALVDIRLPDISGLELLRDARNGGSRTPIAIMTAFPEVESAVQAVRLGASDYLAKSCDPDDYVKAVERALRGFPAPASVTAAASGFVRWAEALSQVVEAPRDPTTEAEWASLLPLRVAPETLRGWIRTVGLSPKDSLDLGRVLRAVHLARQRGSTPNRYLDVADPRTLRRLLQVGGVSGTQVLPTLSEVLMRQAFIADWEALDHLRSRLRQRGLNLDC